MGAIKKFVYVLKSDATPGRFYTGLTSDVLRRLSERNDGRCPSTASWRPWHLDLIVEFPEERRAVAFEKYLKSGSGAAFAVRHLR